MKIDLNQGELLHKSQKGNRQAEKMLYDLLSASFFKIALIHASDRNEALAIFNHSMLEVFKNIKSFQSLEDLQRWFSRVLKNDCYDHCRKKSKYLDKLQKYHSDQSFEYEINEAFTNMAIEDIMTCINALPTEHRLCFVSKALDGHTFKEVAERLNINVNTAKWYYYKAQEILREQLSQRLNIQSSC